MRFLIAGDFRFPWYEEACARALEAIGHQVLRYSWSSRMSSLCGRLEDRFAVSGPTSRQVLGDICELVRLQRPHVALLWRAIHIDADGVSAIRSAGSCPVVSYNNDDPFSPAYRVAPSIQRRGLWRRFVQSIPAYDLNLVFRQANVAEYLLAGAKRVSLLLPYFIPDIHRPVRLSSSDINKFECEVVFVGHYEEDGRVEKLEALANAGLRLRLFGNGWPSRAVRRIASNLMAPRAVLGDEYAKALCGARVCLSFLSKLNRDTYTRRSFEIPACGRMMLSERTSDLLMMFHEDREAVYFSSTEELVTKALKCVTNTAFREEIAIAGLQRCWADGHDVISRMRGLLVTLNELRMTVL